jgi:adenosylcobinamide-phosphate synthase
MLTIARALILDLLLGDKFIFKHPVAMIGSLIIYLEKKLYKYENRKTSGLIMLVLSLVVVGIVIFLIQKVVSFNKELKFIIIHYLMYLIPSAKTLKDMTNQVMKSIQSGDLTKARLELSYLVGRDTEELDENSIMKAAIETSAENTIDGLLAPVFYMIVGSFFGQALLFGYLYKTVNTLDSMIGYKNRKYKDFGYFSAKTDDVLNYIPARIGSVIMMLAGALLRFEFWNALKIYIRDRNNHSSPNSGHPESVVAGLLRIRLGGDSSYFGEIVKKPSIGDSDREIEALDILKTNKVLIVSDCIMIIILFIGALA